jgi:CDP-glucose 4,6-dehydratase
MNQYWKDKNVFVTGASGFIGSRLVKSLVDGGAYVVCLVRDIVPNSSLYLDGYHKKVTIIDGDLCDYFILMRGINEYEIDTVFHLGAQTIVGTANRSPLSTFESNIKGTWNLLEACRNSRLVKRIVVASSDKAYGATDTIPYTESTPLRGMHPYDCSKSCADLLSQCYFNTYRLPLGIARCGNFFGPGDLNYNRIVPGTIRSVYNGQSPIIRSDGTYVRDYIYVTDSAEAYLLLAEKLDDAALHGEAFNFSNENRYTVLEMVEMILSLMDRKDLKPKILNEAAAEIKVQSLSAKKAHEVLGWKARYEVKDGLRETIDWYKRFFDSNSGRGKKR